jgi:hypothetical protein
MASTLTELSFNVVKKQLEELVDKPSEYQKLALTAVQKWGTALKFINKDMMTELICQEAVKNDGYALQYVPKELQNETMCISAIKQNRYYVRYVQILTDNIFESILQLAVDIKQFNPEIFDQMMLAIKGVDIRTCTYLRVISFLNETNKVSYIKTTGLTALEYVKMLHGDNLIDLVTLPVAPPIDTVYYKISDNSINVFKVEEHEVVESGWIPGWSSVKKVPIHRLTHQYETIQFS